MNPLRQKIRLAAATFWFVPAAMVTVSIVLAEALIWIEKRFGVPEGLLFVYQGGESGARSLLSAVTGASIGVAGTVFSITIAALSSVVSTMGPRLLHSFLHDRGIQATLGMFVATFALSLYSLRAVSGGAEGEDVFVPHYNVSVVMAYAALCIGFLVFYIGHMARSISMTRVVNLLSEDLHKAIERGTKLAEKDGVVAAQPPEGYFERHPESHTIRAERGGYVQLIDHKAIVKAAEGPVDILVRAGDQVITGMPIARVDAAGDPVSSNIVIGAERDDVQDLEFSIRQLLEVAVRALSPGTNDPFTAMDVIDRFAEVLARLRDRKLPDGLVYEGSDLVMRYSVSTFEGIVDAMFEQIRQNAAGTVAVYAHLLEAYARLCGVISDPARVAHLKYHAALVHSDAQRLVESVADRKALEDAYAASRHLLGLMGSLGKRSRGA